MGSLFFNPSQIPGDLDDGQSHYTSGKEVSPTLPSRKGEHGSSYMPAPEYRGPEDGAHQPVLRRTVTTTTTTTTFEPSTSSISNTGTVAGLLGVGVVVGMGVGAALTYKALKTEQREAVGERHPESANPYLPIAREVPPGDVSTFSGFDRLVDRGQHPEKFTILAASNSVASYHQKLVHDVPDRYAPRGNQSSGTYGPPSIHPGTPRSITSATRAPILLEASEYRSQAGGRALSHSGSRALSQDCRFVVGNPGSHGGSEVGGQIRGSAGSRIGTYVTSHPGSQPQTFTRSTAPAGRRDGATASVVSVRSQRSFSTVVPPGRPPPPSRPGTTVFTATPKPPPTGKFTSAPSRISRTPSVISARQVALPNSVVGSNRSSIIDDAESIAPSDSISCVSYR